MCAKDCWNALEGAERPRSRKQELRQQRTPSSEGGLRPDAPQKRRKGRVSSERLRQKAVCGPMRVKSAERTAPAARCAKSLKRRSVLWQ